MTEMTETLYFSHKMTLITEMTNMTEMTEMTIMTEMTNMTEMTETYNCRYQDSQQGYMSCRQTYERHCGDELAERLIS